MKSPPIMKLPVICLLIAAMVATFSCKQQEDQIHAFGEYGQLKMLYDRRQRPQSVYLDGKVHIVFNAGADPAVTSRAASKPMGVTYDPATQEFSGVVTLGEESRDHHDGPVIWADSKDHLHVLYGCHRNPGTHLISKEPGSIGTSRDDWIVGPEIAASISYPTTYRVLDDQQVMYFRYEGHIGFWTYRLSADDGRTWTGPPDAVTDLDSKGRFQWSSYQCKLPGKDGRSLHVVFTAYDDNRSDDSARYYNPRYRKQVTNEWKYNLYYVRVDLATGEVYNFEGDPMDTPVDLGQANERCLIWDTDWRGAGVPPDIVLDKNGDPAFLHVLSEETTEHHNYYFVHRSGGEWKHTVIAPSNHQWNSCHVQRDRKGTYHAYLVTGEGYFGTHWVEGRRSGGGNSRWMDKHGGGKIEEWISEDEGNSWVKAGDIEPDPSVYEGWKYNNIQPVTRPDGSVVEGLLLFYGWKDPDAPRARAFLLHRKNFKP